MKDEDDYQIVIPKDPSTTSFVKGKYYVYALFKKGDFTPFYVGKGLNTRINQHFFPSSLNVDDSRKNKTIRKYFKTIRREILCYFDSEDAAFDFEEYLIKYYGLIDEGGWLLNVMKVRNDFPETVKKNRSSLKRSRVIVYTEDEILTVYKNYFEKIMTIKQSVVGTRVPKGYGFQVVSGEKFKNFYQKYIASGVVKNLRTCPVKTAKRKEPESQKYSDADLVEQFNLVCSGNSTVGISAKILGCSETWLGTVFLGKSRPYLQLDTALYRSLEKGRSFEREKSYKDFIKLYPASTDLKEISEKINKSISRIHAYRRRYEKEVGMNES